MAIKNNIKLTSANGWVNVNTVSSITVGGSFVLQNNSTGVIMIAESVSQPTDTNSVIYLYPVSYGMLSIINVSATDTVWIKNENNIVADISVSE